LFYLWLTSTVLFSHFWSQTRSVVSYCFPDRWLLRTFCDHIFFFPVCCSESSPHLTFPILLRTLFPSPLFLFRAVLHPSRFSFVPLHSSSSKFLASTVPEVSSGLHPPPPDYPFLRCSHSVKFFFPVTRISPFPPPPIWKPNLGSPFLLLVCYSSKIAFMIFMFLTAFFFSCLGSSPPSVLFVSFK